MSYASYQDVTSVHQGAMEVGIMRRLMRVQANRQDGATAVEYAIMVALIAVVIMGAVFAIGQQLNEKSYKCVKEALDELPDAAVCIP